MNGLTPEESKYYLLGKELSKELFKVVFNLV